MKIRCTLVASAAAVGMAAAAPAAFVEVVALDAGDLDGDPTTTTWRLYAEFDDPVDRLVAVNGLDGVSPLVFEATAALIQNAGPFDGLIEGDVPSILDAGGDSWVTIGGNPDGGESDTLFSPGFLGGDGNASIISGDFFEQPDNGGYFDSNPGTPENGGSVIIAQFTLPSDATAVYRGTASWATAGSGSQFSAFEVAFGIPGPAAASLLGLAGLVGLGGRRRR